MATIKTVSGLKPKQAKRREELRKKMLKCMAEEGRLRNQINKIDLSQKLKKQKWMLGKCFSMKSESDIKAFCRVDKFRGDGRPVGVKLYLSGRKVSSIEFDSPALWEDDIVRGKKISHARFNKYLEQANILTHTAKEGTLKQKIKSKKPAYQNFADKVRKIKPTVALILKRDLDARDDDNLLCCLLWELQGAKPNMKFKEFRRRVIMGELATPESITRSRRLLQEKYPDLRGEYYNERHEQEELLKRQLRMDLFD